MFYIAQIVELERCLANVQAWLRFDRHGAEVALMKEIQDWSLKKR